MAHFDTSLVLAAITNDTLADHESNRQILELVEQTHGLSGIQHPARRSADKQTLVYRTLEIILRQMARSQHGHDLVVGLMDRLTEEARAESLARIELQAAGLTWGEIEDTIIEFPEVVAKYMRPSRAELDAGGPI
jgi:hypothetical protein